MIDVTHFSDEQFESAFVPLIDATYDEVQSLLNNLPTSVRINFTDNGASDVTGVGGFADSREQLNIALIKNFHDKAMQKRNVRGVIFHESFHIQQGFTFDKSPFTALEAAIYEGCAVVFEQEYTQEPVVYADYGAHTTEELEKWLDEIKAIGTAYFEDYDTWQRWAFYHPGYDQKWIIYKVGMWLIDTILKQQNLTILALKDMTAAEIYQLMGV